MIDAAERERGYWLKKFRSAQSVTGPATMSAAQYLFGPDGQRRLERDRREHMKPKVLR